MTEWLGASGFSPQFARTRAQVLRLRPRLSAPLRWHSRVEFILGYSQTYSLLNTSRSTSEHLFAPSLLPHTQIPAHSSKLTLSRSFPYYYTTYSSSLSTPFPRNLLAFFRMERGLWGMSTRLSPKILGRLDLKSTPRSRPALSVCCHNYILCTQTAHRAGPARQGLRRRLPSAVRSPIIQNF